MSSIQFSIPAVQGGRVRQRSGAGNIGHFSCAEGYRCDEVIRLDTPG
jgi:hypothetical protein